MSSNNKTKSRPSRNGLKTRRDGDKVFVKVELPSELDGMEVSIDSELYMELYARGKALFAFCDGARDEAVRQAGQNAVVSMPFVELQCDVTTTSEISKSKALIRRSQNRESTENNNHVRAQIVTVE